LRLVGNYTPFNSALRVVASVTTTTHTETAEKNTLAITRYAESYEIVRSNNQRRELIDD
jgi:hypothetical protein